MRFIKIYTIICLMFLSINRVFADTSTTQTFIVDASTSIQVTESGDLTSSINSTTGNLNSALNINFNIVSNSNLSNIQMKAFVTDSSGNLDNAFYCTSTSASTSIPTCLILANTNVTPTQSAISNCECSASTTTENVNAIAYSGTVSIDNNGSLIYNTDGGYFNATINSGTSNLNLVINTTVKSGTFDTTNIEDENGSYKAEIYLDNIQR